MRDRMHRADAPGGVQRRALEAGVAEVEQPAAHRGRTLTSPAWKASTRPSARRTHKNGRACCWARVCQYVVISVGAVSLRNKPSIDSETRHNLRAKPSSIGKERDNTNKSK